MIEIKLPSQRLYLLRDGKQDIYIDFNEPLPQHQLEGIRFLYRQFKKKNPGVILNDPSGYGKCLQTVLFLKAMRPTLTKPILIMCEGCDVDNWKKHFQNWTDFNDIAIETTNPFAKNMVYINTVKEAYTFFRRTWSIVVVHDNTFAKEKLQVVFKADFKIWVTSVDMKENLRAFSLIYEWLHPNSKVNLEDFAAKKNNPKDVIEKSILLDAFFEDVVIRRNEFSTPFTSKSPIRQRIQANIESPPKATRKNKDPTGTKVKRSRKRKDDELDIVDISVNREIVTNRNEDSESTVNMFNFIMNDDKNDKVTENNDKNNEMDIESFIRNQEPIEAEGYDTTSQQSSVNAKSDTSEFQSAINEIVNNEGSVGHSSEYQITGIDNGTVSDNLHLTVTEESSDTQNYFDINVNNGEDFTMKGNISKQQNDNNVSKTDDDSDNDNAVARRGTDFSVPNKNDNFESKDELDGINKSDSEVGKKLDDIKNESDKKEEGSSNDKPVVKKNIDDILAELEEKTLKKFKGSFLDSIF